MLLNLYCYVGVTVKYILRFQTDRSSSCEEYMVFDILEDTGLVNFINACRANQTESFQFSEAQMLATERDSESTKNQNESSFTCQTTYYVNKIFGARKIRCKSYTSIVQDDGKVMYETIKIPISKQLFLKIMCLSKDHIPILKIDDMYVIFKHIFPFKDKVGLLTHAICTHLQEHWHLIGQFKHLLENPCKDDHNELERHMALAILDKSGDSHSFREVVSSYITFEITDADRACAITSENEEIVDNIYYKIDINDLMLGFLFKYISMDYTYLENNKDTLGLVFDDGMDGFLLDVRIYNIDSAAKSIVYPANEVFKNKLLLITECTFLSSTRINRVTLEFKNIKMLFDLALLKNIKVSITAQFHSCSVHLINSVPSNIQNIKATFINKCDHVLNRVPDKNVEALYQKFVFSENVSFPGHVKNIKILNSKIEENVVVSFDKECEYILINKTEGKIDCLGVAGFGVMALLDRSGFEYCKQNTTKQRTLSIDNAEIFGVIYVDANVNNLSIHNAKLSPGSKVIFSDANTCLDISRSEGLIDLTSCIDAEICFQEHTWVRTAMLQDAALSYIFLHNIRFRKPIKLSNNYNFVELHGITMEKHSSITINEMCTILSIHDTSGTIDLTKIEHLHKMKIKNSAGEVFGITFIGTINVDVLELQGAHNNIDIAELLSRNFNEIVHLQFKNEYNRMFHGTVENISLNLPPAYLLTSNFKGFLRTMGKCVPKKRYDSNSSYNAIFNVNMNIIFNENIMKKMSVGLKGLKFMAATITNDDIQCLVKMENLEILKICIGTLTSEFFEHLPRSLRLLDISEPFAHHDAGNFYNRIRFQPNTLPFNNLTVLMVQSNFLPYLRVASALMPSLKILSVHFDSDSLIDSLTCSDKLQLHELFIEVKNHVIDFNHKSAKESKIDCFIRLLSGYINLKALKYLAFVSDDKLLEVDPLTNAIVDRKLYKGVDCDWGKKYADCERYYELE